MPRKFSMLALIVLLSPLAAEVSAEQRTWTSSNGLTLKAEMIRLDGETIHLKRADNGQEIAMKLSQLSPKDREYAKLVASKKAGPPKSAPTEPKKIITDDEPHDSIDFNKVPRPDYATLLRMYYAANKDVLKDDPAFLTEAYAVFLEPKIDFVPFRASYAIPLVNPKDINEFNRPRFIKEFAEKARKELDKSSDWPKTAVFRIHWQLELGEYDFDTQRFPYKSFPAYDYTYQDTRARKMRLTEKIYGLSLEKPQCIVPRLLVSPVRPSSKEIQQMQQRERMQPREPNYNFKCYALFPYALFNQYRSMSLVPCNNAIRANTVIMNLKGGERITGLPMKRDLAEAFIKQLPRLPSNRSDRIPKHDRKLPVELLVKVGPIVIAEGRMAPISARVFAARVINPTTGKTIYRYKFEPEPKATAESTPESSSRLGRLSKEDVPDLTRLQLTLLQLKNHPELMRQERLKEMTFSQIRSERSTADFLIQMKNKTASLKSTIFNDTLNPKRQLFLFEWQKLQQEKDKLASGPLLDIFSGRGEAWSFIKNEAHWDDRFNSYPHITVFSPEKIKDRSIEIATAELLPTMKELVSAVIQKAPTQGVISVGLGTVQYDASSHSLISKRYGLSGGTAKDHNLVTLKEIVNPAFEPPKPIGGVPYAIGFAFPKTVQSLVLYSIRGSGDNRQSQRVGKILGKSYGNGRSDRSVIKFQSNAQHLAHDPVAVALDREIRLERISIDPATAEKLTKISNWESSLQARIIVSKLDVEIAADYTNQGKTRPRGVIRGHVEGVQIESRYGLVIAYIPAADLSEISLSMKKALAEKSKIPKELFPSDKPRKLTPAFIPLLIAKHQPKFFADHIDQFVVARIQHEHWFRQDPTKNVYGVNPATGQAFPRMDNMPDAQQRKQLVDPLSAWVTKNSKVIGNRFTLQFDDVRFESYFGGKTPAPAIFYGTVVTPHTIYAMSSIKAKLGSLKLDLSVSSVPADSNRKNPPAWHDLKDRLETLTERLSLVPPEIYFSDRRFQFVVPNANGNRVLSGNQASLGESSRGGIAGIPVAKPTTEPIIPLLRVDKEIWIPKNGALSSTNQKPILETTMEITKVEVVDDPPPHPWIEAMKQYDSKNHRKKKIEDKGQYVILHVALKSANLVSATTGETLLPLELRDYRTVKKKVVKDKSEPRPTNEVRQPTDTKPIKNQPPSGARTKPANIPGADQPQTSQSSNTVKQQIASQIPNPPTQNSMSANLPKDPQQPSEVNLSNPPSLTSAESDTPQQKSGTIGLMLGGLGLFAVIAVGGIAVVWRIKSSRLSTQASEIENAPSE